MKNLWVLLIWMLLMSDAVAQNIYFTAQGEQDGKPVIYRSMEKVPAGQAEKDFPTLVNISWPYAADANNGMPDASTNADHIAFEDAIESLDQNGVGHLMLVVTGNGRKEWFWYVKDSAGWMAKLNELLVGHKVYPLEIATEHQPDWSTYHHFVSSVEGVE